MHLDVMQFSHQLIGEYSLQKEIKSIRLNIRLINFDSVIENAVQCQSWNLNDLKLKRIEKKLIPAHQCSTEMKQRTRALLMVLVIDKHVNIVCDRVPYIYIIAMDSALINYNSYTWQYSIYYRNIHMFSTSESSHQSYSWIYILIIGDVKQSHTRTHTIRY